MTSTERCYAVTGANGFIGSWLVHKLIARGEQVIALARRPVQSLSPPPGLDWQEADPFASPQVTWRQADILDRDSLIRALEGATHVFHLAAYAHNWAPRRQTYYDVNVQGMCNVFDAAAQHNVQRVVWTSSIVVLGPTPPGQQHTEDHPRSTTKFYTEYERTKAIAEQEALRRARDGFPVVVVLPTRVYGPGYFTESNSATRLIEEYLRGRMPFLVNWGKNVGNWVYVEDVAEGMMLAMNHGRIGERYILGGENASLKDFFHTLDEVTGTKHFQIPIYKFLPLLVAWFMEKRAQLTGHYPLITPGWMQSFLVDWAYSSEKAQRELGYNPLPLVEGLRRTYDWLKRLHKVP
jgi:farnesol dehydrogenase